MSEVTEDVKVEAKDSKKAEKAVAPKMFKLTIRSGEDESEKGDVVLSHNYKQIQIKRDQEVVVGEQYIEVLKHAVMHTETKDANGKMRSASVSRFSFQAEPA